MERRRDESEPGYSRDRSMAETLDLLGGLFPHSYSQAEITTGNGLGGGGIGEGASSRERWEFERKWSAENSTLLPWDETTPGFSSPEFQTQKSGYKIESPQQRQEPLDLLTGDLGFPPSPSSTSGHPGSAFPTPLAENSPSPESAAHTAWASSSDNDATGFGSFFQDSPIGNDSRVSPGYSDAFAAVHGGSDHGASLSPTPRSESAAPTSFFEELPSAREISANADLLIRFDHGTGNNKDASRTPSSRGQGNSMPPFESSTPGISRGLSNFQSLKFDPVSKSNAAAKEHSTTRTNHESELQQPGNSRTRSGNRSRLHDADSCPPRLPPTLTTSSNLQVSNEAITRSLSESICDDQGPSPSSDPVNVDAGEEFYGPSARGMYQAPVRGAVTPGRPVSLELRPHPLRGPLANQVALLACLGGSVFAACDQGLMLWIDVEEAYNGSTVEAHNNLGDEDAAPYDFFDVKIACMIADVANQVVWSGQRDGTIIAWDLATIANGSRTLRLTFQGHQWGITAIGVTSYGDLWAGSERGDLRVWSTANVAEALAGRRNGSNSMEECTDLMNGTSFTASISPLNPEVRYIVEDYAHGMVWCAGAQYIGIWDSRTREIVRLFLGSSGVDLSMIDVGLCAKESQLDNDAKLVSSKAIYKKEKIGGWFQRSRNAVMGAADAFKRVASGGNEESKTLKALVTAADGTVWGGYGNGALVHWDRNGYKLWELVMPSTVKSLCVVGNRLWVGYADGRLEVIEMESRKPLESWPAHRLAVSQAAVCRGHVFTMGQNGSIRGWDISFPNRWLDTTVSQNMREQEKSFTRQQKVQILAASWNTAEETCSVESARSWLAPAATANIVVVGLQEVEVGAGVLGMAAVKESVGMGIEKGSEAGQGWLKLLDRVLMERKAFKKVASRQLAGMLIGVWVDESLEPYVGDVEVGAVACGFGRTFGNKGAVGVKLLLFRRTVCVLTSHLAAHMDQVFRRNADFEHIYSQLSFSRVGSSSAGVTSTMQSMLRVAGSSSRRYPSSTDPYYMDRASQPSLEAESSRNSDEVPELARADLLVWTGDMNYRIDNLSYDEIIDHIDDRQWASLLSKDQLRVEMQNRQTFIGLREGPINFQPTYKFDKGTDDYDTGEKRRLPAWCDRVLFRDSFGGNADRAISRKQSLEKPCKASVALYDSCMAPKESDHKPVRCMLSVDLSVIDESKRRHTYGIIRDTDPDVVDCLEESNHVPEASLSSNRLTLEGNATAVLQIDNKESHGRAFFRVHCKRLSHEMDGCACGHHERANASNGKEQRHMDGFGFPRWLEVRPALGVVEAGNSASIRVRAMPSSNDEEPQENVVVLQVHVRGAFCSSYANHRVCISNNSAVQFSGKERGTPRPHLIEQHFHSRSAETKYRVSAYLSERNIRNSVQDKQDWLL